MSLKLSPPRRSVGLTLERLEARDVPASFWWNPDTPTAGVFSAATAHNWTQPDPNGNWVRSAVVPGPADDLSFDGGVSSENCTIPDQSPVAPAVAFNGLHLKFGWLSASRVGPPSWTAYSGTVTIKDSFVVGTLEMESGAIKQADQVGMNPPVPLIQFAGTLTVNSSLSWTGGTLNSNSVAGKIDLAPGASGVAEPSFTNPGINGTVKLGSTLSLKGTNPDAQTGVGSTLNMIGGTFEVFRAEIIVGGFSNLFLIADQKADPLKGTITLEKKEEGTLTDRYLWVKPKGTATVTTSRAADAPDTPGEATLGVQDSDALVDNNGTVVINNRTKLLLKGKPDSLKCGYIQSTKAQTPGGPVNPDPVTRLETSSAIEFVGTDGKIFIASGRLEIPRRVIGNTPADDPVAILKAKTVKLDEGAVVVMTSPEWCTLKIAGDFIYQGEFRAAIGRVTDLCDQILATGDVTVDPDKAKLTLRWQSTVPLAGQRVWPVIKSETGEISDEPKDNLATLDEGNALQVLLSDDEKQLRVSRRVD